MQGSKKTIAYIAVSLVALTGGYFIFRYFSDKAALKEGQPQPQPKGEIPAKTNSGKSVPTPSVDSKFPLKVGSRNDYVGELQDALGIATDKIFGKQTLAALKEQTGKSQISSYDELQQTIADIIAYDNAQNVVSDKSSRANSIINQFNSGIGLTDMVLLNDSVFRGFIQDNVSNDYKSTGMILNWKKGKVLNLNDYQPDFVMDDGSLMLYVPHGTLQGYWKVNPNDITIK